MNEQVLNRKRYANGNIEKALFLASVFFLPLWQIVSYVCWGLLVCLFIMKREPMQFHFKIFRAYYVFFLLHLIGVFISNHFADAWSDLAVKIPLILFPLIFSPLLNQNIIGKVKSFFCYGTLAATIYLMIRALVNYEETGNTGCFYYINYSTYLHPTFFTIFLNVSLLFLFEKLAFKKFQNAAEKYLIVAQIIFFLFNVYLALARLSEATVIITLAFYVFLLLKHKSYLIKGAVFIGILLIATILVFNNSRFQQFKDANVDEHNPDKTSLDTTYFNSTRTRIILFETGLAVFKNHFITGTGLANYDEDFKTYLKENNYPYLARKFTGPHNQYLETAILLGVPGLILLVYLYIGNIFKFLRKENNLAASFVLIFAINALGEYTLRASGILIFCLLIVMFENMGALFPPVLDHQNKTPV